MRLDNETDPKILRQAVTLLEKENQKLTQKIVELMREIVALKGGGADQVAERIADLEKQLASKNQLLFGASSEKRPGDKSAEDSASEQSKPPRTGHGPKAQPKLPVV